MAFPLSSLLLLLILFLNINNTQQVSDKLILEEGYTVTTVLDGNKLSNHMNPSSVLSGTHDLIVLDSPNSVFYTISIPISQDSVISRLSGNGTGFVDGDLSSAMFDHPRSFAVDLKGNVYVVDKKNYAIRKISKSGVTTIAGGQSEKKPGNVDGPAQNATFSDDFELAFVPGVCALLISDRGNRLIRQINLKPNDCASGSHWQLGSTGSILLGVSCLILGSAITVAVGLIWISRTGSHRQPLVQQDMEALPNQSGETSSDRLLRHQKRSC